MSSKREENPNKRRIESEEDIFQRLCEKAGLSGEERELLRRLEELPLSDGSIGEHFSEVWEKRLYSTAVSEVGKFLSKNKLIDRTGTLKSMIFLDCWKQAFYARNFYTSKGLEDLAMDEATGEIKLKISILQAIVDILKGNPNDVLSAWFSHQAAVGNLKRGGGRPLDKFTERVYDEMKNEILQKGKTLSKASRNVFRKFIESGNLLAEMENRGELLPREVRKLKRLKKFQSSEDLADAFRNTDFGKKVLREAKNRKLLLNPIKA